MILNKLANSTLLSITKWLDQDPVGQYIPVYELNTELYIPTPWTQDVSLTYIRRSEDVQDVFGTSYACQTYVMCPGGIFSW